MLVYSRAKAAATPMRSRARASCAWSCAAAADGPIPREADVPGSWALRYGSYHVPQVACSDVEDARYHHDDLAASALDEVELTAELLAATWGLARGARHRHVIDREWLMERRARLQAALHGLRASEEATRCRT
jgi:hypothetical protein